MWREMNNHLERTFEFQDFVTAFAFMTQVAFHAERLQHHPDWSNAYANVMVRLTTHDAGSIVTDKDWELARVMDEIYEQYR